MKRKIRNIDGFLDTYGATNERGCNVTRSQWGLRKKPSDSCETSRTKSWIQIIYTVT